jgi:hypothetical protein
VNKSLPQMLDDPFLMLAITGKEKGVAQTATQSALRQWEQQQQAVEEQARKRKEEQQALAMAVPLGQPGQVGQC